MIKKIRPSLRLRLRRPVLGLLTILSLLTLTVGAARPQRVTVLPEQKESRNIVLALDISKSMATTDFGDIMARIDRLSAVKTVVSDFISSRPGDRLGLVVFGSQAFLQAPLTLDHTVVMSMVKRLRVGMAGNGTAIGDGIGVSLRRIQDIEGDAKAIILMTDGVSNSGQVRNPIKAAQVARDLGIKIHTVGIGSKDGAMVKLPGGIVVRDPRSQADFDEETLQKVADITGGVYFHASDLASLKGVYEEIDKLETTVSDELDLERVEELFAPYALASLILYLSLLLLSRSVFLKVP